MRIVLFYYILFLLYKQMKHNGLVEASAGNDQLDLGSNPRSPICFVIFFLKVIRYKSMLALTICLHKSKRQMAQRPDLVIQDESLPWTKSKHAQGIQKVNTGPARLGHRIADQTSKSGPYPLTLPISFYFIYSCFI